MSAIFRLSLSLSLLISAGAMQAQPATGVAQASYSENTRLESRAIAMNGLSGPMFGAPIRGADFNSDNKSDILWQNLTLENFGYGL